MVEIYTYVRAGILVGLAGMVMANYVSPWLGYDPAWMPVVGILGTLLATGCVLALLFE